MDWFEFAEVVAISHEMSISGWVIVFDSKEIQAYHNSHGTEIIEGKEEFDEFAHRYGFKVSLK